MVLCKIKLGDILPGDFTLTNQTDLKIHLWASRENVIIDCGMFIIKKTDDIVKVKESYITFTAPIDAEIENLKLSKIEIYAIEKETLLYSFGNFQT